MKGIVNGDSLKVSLKSAASGRGRMPGHLNYIDHGTGMHVHATAVVGYAILDATTRQIAAGCFT